MKIDRKIKSKKHYISRLQKDCLRHPGSVNTIWRGTRLNNIIYIYTDFFSYTSPTPSMNTNQYKRCPLIVKFKYRVCSPSTSIRG